MNKADFLFVRERMRNVCGAGHEQPVHHYHCGVCGSVIDRIHDECSWDQIVFDQTSPFTLLHDAGQINVENAFFSLFNDNLLVVTNHGKAFLIQGISKLTFANAAEGGSDKEPGKVNQTKPPAIDLQVQEFQLPIIHNQIDKLATDNRYIYILSNAKLYLVDWIDLLNHKIPVIQINAPEGIKDIIRSQQIHAFTDKSLFTLQGIQTRELFVAPEDEKLVGVDVYGSDLLIISSTAQGLLAVRANNIDSRATISKEITLDESMTDEPLLALGASFYAISPDQRTVKVGKLSGLRASLEPGKCWIMDEPVQRMFFVKDYLYLFSGGGLHRWDMWNFTTTSDARISNLNIVKHDPRVNSDSTMICAPVMTARNDSLSIMNLWLHQASISAGFPDKLIAFSVMDNHIFALTKGNQNISIYMG